MGIRHQSTQYLRDLVHRINVVHIIAAIGIINLAAIVLDNLELWYYFYELVTQIEWMIAICIIHYFYKKYPHKNFITSALLSGFFGYSIINIISSARQTFLYFKYYDQGTLYAEEIAGKEITYYLAYTIIGVTISLIIYARLLSQINKTKQKMSNWIKGGSLAIVVLILIFFPYNCKDEETTDTKVTVTEREVEIPEVKGGFESPKTFEENPGQVDTIKITEKVFITVPNKVDRELLAKYTSATDSIEKLHLYVKSIQEKSYTTDYSDENLTLTVDTKVRGELLEQTPKYKIHRQKITVRDTLRETTITKLKKDNFGTIIGGGMMKSLNNEKDAFEISAGVRVGKVTILGSGNTNSQVGLKALIEL